MTSITVIDVEPDTK